MLLEDLYRLMKTGHVQAQGVVDTMTQPVLVLDQNLCVTTANNAFIKSFKVDREDVLSQSFFSLGDGQWDIPELRQLVSTVIPRAAAVIGFEVRHDFPTIGRRTFLVDARRLVHPDDISSNILIIFEDVTEQQRHEIEMDFIVAELRHRMKNMSAVVRSVVPNSMVDDDSAAAFKAALLGRLDITFQAQDIASRGETSDFEFLLRQSVGPAVSERLQCSGPAAEVPSSKVLPISMMFHELATNAMKYGALSTPAGHIRVTWEVDAEPRGRQLVTLQWREEGGPSIERPKRKGYGTELIEGLGAHLAGTVELTYPPEGFIARISIPM